MEHAVAKLALSTLSPVLSLLGTTVYQSYFGGDVTAEDMRKLQIQFLPIIQTVIEEAEYPLPLLHLRPWLDDLRAAVFEAEDLLDLYEYKKIKYQVSSLPKLLQKGLDTTKESLGFMLPKSPLKMCFEKLQKSAEEAKELLNVIRSTPRTTMRQLESTRATTSATSTVSTSPSPIFGREKECDIIIQFLLDESPADSNTRTKKIPITAIKGIGGSGKTTTTQGVYKDPRVVTHFDLRMWVHVSRSFDVHRLTKEIIESATKDQCPQINNLDALQVNLKELISKHRRFLLVLDDIWCEDKMLWDQLLSPLNEFGEKGSKIIITTRMEKVTSNLQVENVIPLEELKTKDCWSILKHYAFHNSEVIIEDRELVNIGDQIINKVKYFPLALRVVGSLLGKRVSVNEWQKILKQNMLEETMDVLLLSFLYLPSHLQCCFAYCSLFPKGHRFYSIEHDDDKDFISIFHLWIAQGFVENTSESELTLEEKGNKYFEELLSYSFFEKNVDRFDECYKMHDLLHDLAQKVSSEHCHRIEDLGSMNIPTTCIHLSIFGKKELENIDTHSVSKMKKLRTLIIKDDSSSEICFKNKDIFKHLTKLRALLDISDWSMGVTVLNCTHIDSLKHLRYLLLRLDDKLPKSFVKLYHLQFFNLITNQVPGNSNSYRVLKANTLPQGFGNLINLRSLKFHGRRNFKYIFSEYISAQDTKVNKYNGLDPCITWCYNSGISIEKLTALQDLSDFGPDGVNGMMSLKRLGLLRSLEIHHLENVKSKTEAVEALLNQKRNLRKLKLKWNINTNITDEYSNTCEEVLDGLEPHPNLEVLKVKGYGGVEAPNWMMKENWLPRLRSLYLTNCRTLKVVLYLPSCLIDLSVRDCDELVQLPSVGNTLKNLWLRGCPKLMAPSMSNRPLCLITIHIISCMEDGNQLFSDLPFLTNLRFLKLVGFSNLQTLPNLSSALETLYISNFPKLTSIGNLQCIASLTEIQIEDCPMLTSVGNILCCTSLKKIRINGCPMLKRDKSLLVEGDKAQRLPCLESIETDDPLLILGEHVFWSVVRLHLYGSEKPFLQMPRDLFYQLPSLKYLILIHFTALPNLKKLSSLKELQIFYCPDVEVLPGLPISLDGIVIGGCPSLEENYKEGGPLRNTIRSTLPICIC